MVQGQAFAEKAYEAAVAKAAAARTAALDRAARAHGDAIRASDAALAALAVELQVGRGGVRGGGRPRLSPNPFELHCRSATLRWQPLATCLWR